MTSGLFDPLGRSPFYPSVVAGEKARALADEAVAFAKREFGETLDWGEASIRAVDAILDRLRERATRGELDGPAARAYADRLGCYVGEVVRRLHGGRWGFARTDGDSAPEMEVGEGRVEFAPCSRANVAAVRGNGDTMWTAYEELLRHLQADPAVGEALRRELVRPRLRYRIRHGTPFFHVGLASRGRQVLMGFFGNSLTALFFDARGKLIERGEHPLSKPEWDSTTDERVDTAEWRAWKAKIRFVPAPIQVQRFQVDEWGLGIMDRPHHLERFLIAPEAEEPGEESRRRAIESLREWEEQGCFVLYWGNNYWLNGEGEVIAS